MNSSIQDLLTRFDHFNDSVLRSFSFTYSRTGLNNASVWIYAQDWTFGEQDVWSMVKFTMDEVSEASFCETHRHCLPSISFGIHVCKFGKDVAIEFGGLFSESIESIDDIRKSAAYVICRDISFEIEENIQ